MSGMKSNELDRLLGKDEPVSLNAKEVCKILEVCRANGVVRLELGGLRVDFGAKVPDAPEPLKPHSLAPLPPPEEQEKIKKELTEQEIQDRRDELMSQLDILDPTAFELLAEQGAVNHAKTNPK